MIQGRDNYKSKHIEQQLILAYSLEADRLQFDVEHLEDVLNHIVVEAVESMEMDNRLDARGLRIAKRGMKRIVNELYQHGMSQGVNENLEIRDIQRILSSLCPMWPFC